MARKLHIVIGAPLTGKTKYIHDNFSNSNLSYTLDYATTYLNLNDSFENETDDSIAEVMTKMSEDLFEEVFLDEKDMVFEFCTGFEESDKDLQRLIELAKEVGFEVHVVQLSCELDEAKRRQEEVKEDPSYYSSYHLNNVVTTILNNFFEDVRANS